MAHTSPCYVAKGDIVPMRFVKVHSADFSVVQATANAAVRGVSQEGSRTAPTPDVSTLLAASSGETLLVYGETEDCLLEIADDVSPGDKLKSDANGKGVPIATTGTTLQQIGAVALEGGASGDRIRVQVSLGSERPALA
ncbi:hypothetical protein [Lignipirellula cremea]|uniref:DUF2190 domain-containing protein n=1 Tax=Lignipirellula cremea TaxID=2528010 RepID=A0A518E0B2_9BACT|nr:hypothetical protein [Lignipirellula cremea]QDU97528.1 hypothetical protein Pla8534_53760 [Lignipirellula cremea]